MGERDLSRVSEEIVDIHVAVCLIIHPGHSEGWLWQERRRGRAGRSRAHHHFLPLPEDGEAVARGRASERCGVGAGLAWGRRLVGWRDRGASAVSEALAGPWPRGELRASLTPTLRSRRGACFPLHIPHVTAAQRGALCNEQAVATRLLSRRCIAPRRHASAMKGSTSRAGPAATGHGLLRATTPSPASRGRAAAGRGLRCAVSASCPRRGVGAKAPSPIGSARMTPNAHFRAPWLLVHVA